MLLHKKAICLSIVFLLSVQKYAYVSAMEMVKGDDAAVENKLNEIGQQYGTVQSFLSTAITSWQADRLDVSRVNLIKTLFESHIKNFPFRPFMGYAEDYPSLRFVILNKHSNMKIQQLTDERFYDCINSYFAAQLFSSQGFWTNNSKFEDIFNRNYQVFNEQAPLNVPDAPRQIDVAGNVQGKDNRPPDPQGNFKKLYFRFQEVYQEELAKLLYERQKTGLQAKPIDKECIKGLLVPPTQGGNEALFLINSITEYGVKIASNYRLEKAFLTILAQKEVNIILENVQKVINLFDQKSSEFEKVITEYMPEKGSRNNVTTLLTNDKPELIYHYIKEGNLRGELNATRIKRLRDRKPEWEETAKKDPCQCLSDINATLSNKGSLLKSIEYLNEVAGIIDTIIWPTLWFVGCVTNNLNFVQWMLQECNELKDHLENTFNVLMRDIDQKRKTGFYTNGMYSHWQQDKEKSIRSLLKFNFQKANLLTFMIQAEEKSQLRYIWFLLKKLATKSEATNKSENEDSDLDKKLDLLDRLLKAETEENLATINALANQLKEGVSISQSKDLSNLELSVTDQEIAIATAKWQKQPEEKEQEKPKQEQLKEQVATGEVGGEPERGPTEPTKLNNQGEVKTAVVVDQKLQTPVVVANEVGDAVVPPIPATQPVIQPHVADPNQSDADTQSQGASSTINPSGTGNPSPTGTPTPWSQWFWNGAVTFFTFLKNKLFWWW